MEGVELLVLPYMKVSTHVHPMALGIEAGTRNWYAHYLKAFMDCYTPKKKKLTPNQFIQTNLYTQAWWHLDPHILKGCFEMSSLMKFHRHEEDVQNSV